MHSTSLYKNSQILIYSGAGANHASSEALFREIQQRSPFSTIHRINAQFLREVQWEPRTTLFVMGGGECSSWEKELGEVVARKIHRFVLNGGRFLGFCAGAYYESALSTFSISESVCIEKQRPYALYPGAATGPSYPIPDGIRSPLSVRASEICLELGGSSYLRGRLYWQGGCSFTLPTEGVAKVIARYSDIPNTPPVAISYPCGSGRVVLCGAHPEFRGDDLPLDQSYLAKIGAYLKTSEQFRRIFFNTLWDELSEVIYKV